MEIDVICRIMNRQTSKQKIMIKNILFLSLVLLFSISCKDKPTETIDYSKENLEATTSIYPEDITKVFDAHGGLDVWKTMQSLEFSMQKDDGFEITTTDLKDRYALIEMPKHTIGFDGNSVWMTQKDTTSYKGNPKFYYNLMFYFYAMPFILADDGINYEKTESLVFEGKTYPGIKISYESGIGESPDDEYILYYDSDTHRMAWLAYTVTYFTKEKAKEFNYIKYSEWQEVDGLLLPKTISWYNYENNQPTTKRNDVNFQNISLSTDKMNFRMFQMPDNAQQIQ